MQQACSTHYSSHRCPRRRPGGQYGNTNNYYYYDVELMRGSVDFIQQAARQQEEREMMRPEIPRPDYSQYELEIARLRDEIDALRCPSMSLCITPHPLRNPTSAFPPRHIPSPRGFPRWSPSACSRLDRVAI